MSELARVLAAERFKASRRRTTYLFPVAIALASAIIVFALDAATRRQWIGVPSGFYLASSSLGRIAHLAAFAGAMLACFHISREYALGTVKAAWVRPVSRGAWWWGKLISAVAASAALFVVAAAVVVAVSWLKPGFADLVETQVMIHPAGRLGLRLSLAIALTLCAVVATTAVSAAIAAACNGPGTAIAATLALWGAMSLLSVFPEAQPWLPTTCLSLPAEQMTAMSAGLPLPREWGDVVRLTLAGAAGWTAVSIVVGRRIVIRKEVTF
ncbi:MAG: ABC transporter permease [Candidatus Krumholzibacteriota bacterium]|nr:ABC transporter permease [Candidatus Krumholzibacteriota bacterium]